MSSPSQSRAGWVDVGRPIVEGMSVYEGDPPVRLRRVADVESDGFALTELAMSVHAGTHVDAPAHVVAGGSGVEALALDDLCGRTWILDARDASEEISVRCLREGVPDAAERLFVATSAAELWDDPAPRADLVALAADAAAEIARRGLRLVGIDYMSIAPVSDPLPVHRTLLEAGVTVLEGLDLRGLSQGWYEAIVAPLPLWGVEGAPARVAVRGLA